ncbi:restriction endonuclease subunit S [Billgrantia lactosivorans]|uniref:restriction endonuclease subunit S n=1 Tax=Billgrantia lactosivorans TaxID=2185141 RepID=UPI0013A68FB1|nr:restriction endonuclease subunit S [Halomonas lactosivorans]
MSEQRVDMPNHAQWPTTTLENLCEVISRGKGPRYVEASTVNAIGQRCITDKGFDPSLSRPHDDKVMGGHLIPAGGDVLLNSTGTGTIGRSSVFDGHGNFIVDSHVTLLRPRNNQVDPRWLNELLRNPRFQRHLEANCYTGSTNQLELSRSQLMKASVPTPSHEEQRFFAHILDTLDTQIQKTEALIAKLEKVKEGMLHDLLTRGIDENGQLRPSPEQAPELYKESPLGLIPREWECQTLGEIARILHGYAFEGEFFSDKPEGKRLLTPGNFHRNGGLYFEPGNSKWFTGKIPSGYVLSDSDAVTVMTDLSPKTLILGRAVVLGEGEDLLHNQRIGKISLRDQSVNCIDFVVLAINSQKFRHQVVAEATGTTVRHTSPERMMSVKMATPPKAEQLRIDSAYRATKTKIHSEKSTLRKLNYEKASLMDDLLTGRVRVTPLLDQAQATTPA